MGVIRKKNPQTGEWEIFGSTHAKDINLIDTLDTTFFSVLENRMVIEEELPEFLFLNDVVLEGLNALRGFIAVRIRVNRLRERVYILVTDTRGVRSNSLRGESHGDRAKQDRRRCFSGSGLHSFYLLMSVFSVPQIGKGTIV